MPRNALQPRAVLTAVAIVIAVLLALTLLYLAWRVITWMVIALMLALALDHAVRALQGRGMQRGRAIALVVAVVALGLSAIGFVFIPPLVAQLVDFANAIPDILDKLSRGRGPLGFLEREFDIVDRAREAIGTEEGVTLGTILGAIGGPLLTAVESATIFVVGALAVIFLTLFMLVNGPGWVDGAFRLLPEPARPYWERAALGLYDAIGGWVAGAAAIAFVAGTTATIFLLAIGSEFAFSLGLLVAVLDPVPFLGALLAAAIVSLVLLATEGWILAAAFLAFVVVYQLVENNVLYPVVYGRTVQLSPLAVLVAVLLGGELAGILGAVAAIPIAGAIKVVAGEVMQYRRDRLIERQPLQAAQESRARSSSRSVSS